MSRTAASGLPVATSQRLHISATIDSDGHLLVGEQARETVSWPPASTVPVGSNRSMSQTCTPRWVLIIAILLLRTSD